MRLLIIVASLLSTQSCCRILSCCLHLHGAFAWVPPTSSTSLKRSYRENAQRSNEKQAVLRNSVKDGSSSTTVESIGKNAEKKTSDQKQNTIMSDFEDFVGFLQAKQIEIIQQLEDMESSFGSSATFSNDPWGLFSSSSPDDAPAGNSGGITRVLQGGNVIEKGACSLTLIRQGILTAERANTIRARQDAAGMNIQAGDSYAAAALSMVLHSRSPMVPTFRSDVRIFLVQHTDNKRKNDDNDDGENEKTNEMGLAWFGGGADLTPYYLVEDDIRFFHQRYHDLCAEHGYTDDNDQKHNGEKDDAVTKPGTFTYASMKKACDDYFYLPARREHRGTGGVFFDDMELSEQSLAFTKGVVEAWMPSWIPIVQKRQSLEYTDQQRQWQLLRRGRYLEFNLLYDRGVKFGLANANPRVEGVMVSAPPLIAYEYCHTVEEGSNEAELMAVLKEPREWL